MKETQNLPAPPEPTKETSVLQISEKDMLVSAKRRYLEIKNKLETDLKSYPHNSGLNFL